MSYAQERERFIYTMSPLLVLPTILRILRHATTLQRLAEAQCNGDWPADNGERKIVACPKCECSWAPSVIKRGLCPDCRSTEAIEHSLEGSPYMAVFNGDPRGAVVSLYQRGTSQDDISSGRERGIYVPSRS